jgi:hypothetical protein
MTGCGFSPASSSPAAAGAMPVQAGALSPSVIGYAWDQSVPGLRPIVGVSGASSLGAPIFGDDKYASAVTSAQKQYALLTDAKSRLFLALLPSGQPTLLSDGLSSKQQVRLSPSGSLALIYAPDQPSVILIQGLPQSPQLETIPIPRSVVVNQAAVGDTGLVALATETPGGIVVVRSLNTGGTATQIATLSTFGGLSFLPRSTSLLMADAGQNTLLLASGLPNSPALSQVASAKQGINQPFLVAASSDGRWATVANQDASFVRIDLTMHSAPSVAKCICSPIAMIPLRGNSVFLVSDLSAGPLWMFDGDPLVSRVVFIGGLKQSAVAGGLK